MKFKIVVAVIAISGQSSLAMDPPAHLAEQLKVCNNAVNGDLQSVDKPLGEAWAVEDLVPLLTQPESFVSPKSVPQIKLISEMLQTRIVPFANILNNISEAVATALNTTAVVGEHRAALEALAKVVGTAKQTCLDHNIARLQQQSGVLGAESVMQIEALTKDPSTCVAAAKAYMDRLSSDTSLVGRRMAEKLPQMVSELRTRIKASKDGRAKAQLVAALKIIEENAVGKNILLSANQTTTKVEGRRGSTSETGLVVRGPRPKAEYESMYSFSKNKRVYIEFDIPNQKVHLKPENGPSKTFDLKSYIEKQIKDLSGMEVSAFLEEEGIEELPPYTRIEVARSRDKNAAIEILILQGDLFPVFIDPTTGAALGQPEFRAFAQTRTVFDTTLGGSLSFEGDEGMFGPFFKGDEWLADYGLNFNISAEAGTGFDPKQSYTNQDLRGYYETLDLNPQSHPGPQGVKNAYRKKAMQYHPDRNPGDKHAEEMFKQAQGAYEFLTKYLKR